MNSKGVLDRLTQWVAHPVKNDMDFVSVVLTTILVVTIAFAWSRILAHITE